MCTYTYIFVSASYKDRTVVFHFKASIVSIKQASMQFSTVFSVRYRRSEKSGGSKKAKSCKTSVCQSK